MNSEPLKKRKNSRAKGHRQERVLVKKFADWWKSEFFRTPGSGAFATRGFIGANLSFAGDITTTDKTFPFLVESKNEEGWEFEQLLTADKNKMRKWWKQTCAECPHGSVPLLVFTRNHKPEFYMMPEDAYMSVEPELGNVLLVRTTTCLAVLGVFEELLKTKPGLWKGVKTNAAIGPEAKDLAEEQAKAEKSFDKVFDR